MLTLTLSLIALGTFERVEGRRSNCSFKICSRLGKPEPRLVLGVGPGLPAPSSFMLGGSSN